MTNLEKRNYATEAAAFHKWGASLIPLGNPRKDKGQSLKAPKINNWQKYCKILVPSAQLNEWLDQYPDNNCGLALGMEIQPGLQLIAIDVDDGRFGRFITALTGGGICQKKGEKGFTAFFKANVEMTTSNYHLGKSGKPVVEVLTAGRQTVMPPSIHPNTNLPYEYVGCLPLYEYAPEDITLFTEEMNTCLSVVTRSEHTKGILFAQGTHDATLALTAQLVSAGVGAEVILRAVPELFPLGYNGNSIKELPEMVVSALNKGFSGSPREIATDLKISKQLISELQPMVYVEGEGFLKYKDGYWRELPERQFEKYALDAASLYVKKGQVAPMIRHVKQCTILELHRNEFGKFSEFICCRNGTLNILTGELDVHSPEYQLRYKLDFDYDPDAKCELYDAFIHRTLLEDEKAVRLFDEFAGHTLIPDNRFHKALFLIGEGGGGKSTALKLVMSMHDRNAVSVTPITKVDDERHITDLATKLLCLSMDIQPKHSASVFGEGFVRITGGDNVTTRRLYSEVKGNVTTSVRFLGSMNQLPPKFIAAPDALKRRLIFLQCGGKVESPDPDFMTKLLAERSGILTRWVQALQRLIKRGYYEIPESSLEMVQEYLETQDPVQCYINEALVIDDNASTNVGELFLAYNVWADRNNEQRFSKNVFGKHLKAAGLKSRFKKNHGVAGRDKTMRVYNAQIKPEYSQTF